MMAWPAAVLPAFTAPPKVADAPALPPFAVIAAETAGARVVALALPATAAPTTEMTLFAAAGGAAAMTCPIRVAFPVPAKAVPMAAPPAPPAIRLLPMTLAISEGLPEPMTAAATAFMAA